MSTSHRIYNRDTDYAQVIGMLRGGDVKVLAFDPGETTGWSVLEDKVRVACGTSTMLLVRKVIIDNLPLDYIVYEAWRLYPWKKNEAQWSEFIPVQVVGIIRDRADELHIPTREQSASIKQVVTNTMLQRTGLWSVNESPHVRDATRHAVHFYIQWKREQCEHTR